MEPVGDSTTESANKQGNVGRGRPPREHQFKKGQSGNPKGKPKGTLSITKHIRAALEANDHEKAKQLADALIYNAAKGNGAAMKQILDRIDGPVKEELELTNPDGAMTPLVTIYLPDNGRTPKN